MRTVIEHGASYLDLEEAVLLPDREEMQLINLNFNFNINTVVVAPVQITENLNISVLSSGAQSIVSNAIQSIAVKV